MTLNIIWKEEGLKPFLNLLSSNRTLWTIAIRQIILQHKRSITAYFCNLNLGDSNKIPFMTQSVKKLETLRQTEYNKYRCQNIKTIANLTKSEETHDPMKVFINMEALPGQLQWQTLNGNKEIQRLLSNLTASRLYQDNIYSTQNTYLTMPWFNTGLFFT